MSYDLTLYRSPTGIPDVDEALAREEAQEDQAMIPDAPALARAEKIAAALLAAEPTLERFEPPDGIDSQAFCIELNTPGGDRAPLQISIFADEVGVSIAAGHGPKRARRIFARFDRIARTVHEAAGYLVFDPQCEQAWDPTQRDAYPDAVYIPMQPVIASVATRTPAAAARPSPRPRNDEPAPSAAKPWWRFW